MKALPASAERQGWDLQRFIIWPDPRRKRPLESMNTETRRQERHMDFTANQNKKQQLQEKEKQLAAVMDEYGKESVCLAFPEAWTAVCS